MIEAEPKLGQKRGSRPLLPTVATVRDLRNHPRVEQSRSDVAETLGSMPRRPARTQRLRMMVALTRPDSAP